MIFSANGGLLAFRSPATGRLVARRVRDGHLYDSGHAVREGACLGVSPTGNHICADRFCWEPQAGRGSEDAGAPQAGPPQACAVMDTGECVTAFAVEEDEYTHHTRVVWRGDSAQAAFTVLQNAWRALQMKWLHRAPLVMTPGFLTAMNDPVGAVRLEVGAACMAVRNRSVAVVHQCGRHTNVIFFGAVGGRWQRSGRYTLPRIEGCPTAVLWTEDGVGALLLGDDSGRVYEASGWAGKPKDSHLRVRKLLRGAGAVTSIAGGGRCVAWAGGHYTTCADAGGEEAAAAATEGLGAHLLPELAEIVAGFMVGGGPCARL